jgi:hypothetical protein
VLRVGIIVQGIGTIWQLARDAIKYRESRQAEEVWLLFNELSLRVSQESTVESICKDYDRLRKEHHYGEHCPYRR